MKTETVVNTLLKAAKDKKVELTHLQIQKLVYFLHGYYLAKNGKPLVEEPFQAWQYGPVLTSLYESLKKYGSQSVKAYLPTIDKTTGEEKFFVVAEANEEFWRVFELVWDKYAKLSGSMLSSLSHKKGSPWDLTPNLRQVISNAAIESYFKKEIEVAG